MPAPDSEPRGSSDRQEWFATTHWSVVLAARQKDEPAAVQALEKLCRTYWPPLYAFIRREGHNDADAQDLTQAFFAHLLERDFLNRLEDQRGKFRSFLLAFLTHFLSDQRDRVKAQKRGGAMTLISLDDFAAEDGHTLEAADRLTPDQVFDRRWAQTVMAQALNRLGDEYRAGGKSALYEQLKDLQPGERGEATYAETGARLGMSEQAIKSAMHRLRLRHREILREEIAHTVMRPEEIDAEIRHLIEVLGG